MAKPKQRKPRPKAPTLSQHLRSQSEQPPQLVHPLWLLKALAAILALALVCAYAALCLLYWQGQWQLVLHPSRTVQATPASLHLSYNEVHFFAAAGKPQLDGWWIPAAGATATNAPASAAPVVLMLHGGAGSMADALPRALTLHNAHLNVLLFDYRGFGHSTGRHPTEQSMQQDATAALNWLLTTQHRSPRDVVLYGVGLGASLAIRLASAHHDLPAIILDSPDGDFTERARTDPRSRMVPARLLFTQTFPLADPLHTLATPKLLISYTTSARPPLALARAANPKVTLEVASPNDPALLSCIVRFLDLYLPHASRISP